MSESAELGALRRELNRQLVAGDLAAVTATGQQVLRVYPRHLATYRDLAWAALLGGQDLQAADLLGRVVSVDPEDGEAWAHLAQLVHDRGQRQEAARYWLLAFDLCPWGAHRPRFVDVRSGLRRADPAYETLAGGRLGLTPAAHGHLLARGRHWRRAAEVLHPLAQRAPDRLDLRLALAGALWQLGDTRSALGLAREVLKVLPYALKAQLLVAAGPGADSAAAQRVVEDLDPNGDYAARWFGPEWSEKE